MKKRTFIVTLTLSAALCFGACGSRPVISNEVPESTSIPPLTLVPVTSADLFLYETSEDTGVTITGIKETSATNTILNIPEEIMGIPVVAIGKEA